MNPLHADLPNTDQVTLYHAQDISWARLEARRAEIKGGHSTCQRWLRYVPRGGRKVRGWIPVHPTKLVILAGWKHPDPPPSMKEVQSLDDIPPGVRRATSEVVPLAVLQSRGGVHCLRYDIGDPQWDVDFNRFLLGYRTQTPTAEVLRDYRGAFAGDRERLAGGPT